MPNKNDLSAVKAATETPNILPEKPAETPLTKRKTGVVGRPKKAPEEKRNYKITLSLTQTEGKKITAKAGLAGEATYLYAMLEKAGIFK